MCSRLPVFGTRHLPRIQRASVCGGHVVWPKHIIMYLLTQQVPPKLIIMYLLTQQVQLRLIIMYLLTQQVQLRHIIMYLFKSDAVQLQLLLNSAGPKYFNLVSDLLQNTRIRYENDTLLEEGTGDNKVRGGAEGKATGC
ncbi:hypothetical protein CEUSTIGMA_g4656.t1 [Chlamydomonas eustigma]|uniref:Uncharacterized protein n=1 Tax=Chlamydomonas eustigma TaxID=1157962 RepID=A0A250X364_9CHLO|nr:hypothetical protein CEUSTIGMA_g4656.t1 [Chlamydomonas eustigma]|eukprot:GAX77210.1 hypothetical protein CEUSTIGMA_g4656.t1 [Chlamydomonas eustigma]